MNGLSLVAILCLSGGLWIGANAQCCQEDKLEECCKFCPDGWTRYKGRCFYYVAKPEDFGTAEYNCVGLGGNLVSIHSKPELTFIEGVIRRVTGVNKRIWAGGFDSAKEGSWMWTDGSKFNFRFWGRRQPDNGARTEHCMELNWRGMPNDHQCYHKKPYMCAKDL
ncbi:galactose-specific lectin nattectin-like [Synchiropus splendidus]|uniref:galactose-specific lectin nattectin-like n=1 Tax=Synchiropus splendidus TaxID=270530 RepID=UPI00237DD2AA|nr:galactose-specific lectin nattectin-like [Synchiropus splendidus]